MPGKVKYNNLNEKERKKYLGDFYDMISMLSNRDEAKSFFKDLLILSETVMISRRLQIAQKLLSGISHEDIIEDLKVGSATITQVDKWLNNGFGGYRKIIEKHNKKSKKQQTKDLHSFGYSYDSFEGLRKRYPSHFLLLNLLTRNKK